MYKSEEEEEEGGSNDTSESEWTTHPGFVQKAAR
jgi:hypothetical protein